MTAERSPTFCVPMRPLPRLVANFAYGSHKTITSIQHKIQNQ